MTRAQAVKKLEIAIDKLIDLQSDGAVLVRKMGINYDITITIDRLNELIAKIG